MARREQTMKSALNEVWQGIGPDVLQSWDKDADGNVTLTGEDVAGVVVDYAETYLPQELCKAWHEASYEQKHVWLDEAFPKASNYGY